MGSKICDCGSVFEHNYGFQGIQGYKLVFNGQSGKLVEKVELKSLGGDALFVGHNYLMSVSAMNFLGN